MDIIIYNESKNLFEYSGIRPAFIPNSEPMQPGSVTPFPNTDVDICHSISFYTIVTGILNALNYFKFYEHQATDRAKSIIGIAGMIVSVKTEAIPATTQGVTPDPKLCFDWVDAKVNANDPAYLSYKQSFIDLKNVIFSTDFPTNKDLINRCVYHFMAVKASEIVRLLNSEKKNLRLGYNKWNRSIGSAYDPINPVYNPALNRFEITNDNDCIRLSNLFSFTIGKCTTVDKKVIPGTVDALYFYTFCVPSKTPGNYVYKICSSNIPLTEWIEARNVSSCRFPIAYKNYFIKNNFVTIDTYVPSKWQPFSLNTAPEQIGMACFTDEAKAVEEEDLREPGELEVFHGIDISEHNGVVDFDKVISSDISFVMIREGYGNEKLYPWQIDKLFEENYKKAKAKNLNVGAYHYLYATTPEIAEAEAEGFLANLKGKQFEMPIALDIEDPYQSNLSPDTIGEIIKRFINICKAAGYCCVLYSYESFLQNKVPPEVRNNYDVWCANTSRSPRIPFVMHQYSFNGRINGINGDVDLDCAYKDYPALIKKEHKNGF
jgi:lyzozyme M1 (1,4-beta-N-acetylmuramidase)